MRNTAVAACVVAALVMALWGSSDSNLAADRSYPPVDSADLITVPLPADGTHQMLLVLDRKERVLCVYRLQLATGAVELKSVRSLKYDLQIEEFNGVSPLPKEIRSLIDTR